MEMGHSGHPGRGEAKRLWFPQMDSRIEQVTEECVVCQASTKITRRDQLVTKVAPEEP